jgi:hypothetical protein
MSATGDLGGSRGRFSTDASTVRNEVDGIGQFFSGWQQPVQRHLARSGSTARLFHVMTPTGEEPATRADSR